MRSCLRFAAALLALQTVTCQSQSIEHRDGSSWLAAVQDALAARGRSPIIGNALKIASAVEQCVVSVFNASSARIFAVPNLAPLVVHAELFPSELVVTLVSNGTLESLLTKLMIMPSHRIASLSPPPPQQLLNTELPAALPPAFQPPPEQRPPPPSPFSPLPLQLPSPPTLVPSPPIEPSPPLSAAASSESVSLPLIGSARSPSDSPPPPVAGQSATATARLIFPAAPPPAVIDQSGPADASTPLASPPPPLEAGASRGPTSRKLSAGDWAIIGVAVSFTACSGIALWTRRILRARFRPPVQRRASKGLESGAFVVYSPTSSLQDGAV